MTTRWPRPDFLARRSRPPALAWLWAVTGALVLAATAADALAERRAVELQAARLAQATQRATRVSRPAASPAAAAAAASVDTKADADAIRAARRLVDRLNHPWDQILSNLEAEAPAGLQWLVFDHDSDSPELRLEGAAPDVATALRLVDMLAARPGWSEVALSRLQAPDPRDSVALGPLWRFELHAVIDAQRVAAARQAWAH